MRRVSVAKTCQSRPSACVAEQNTSPLLGGHGAVNAVAEGNVRHLNIMGESVHNAPRPWPCYSRPAHVDSVCVCVCDSVGTRVDADDIGAGTRRQ